MNSAQRRIATRTLFTVAVLCVVLLIAALALFAGTSHSITEGLVLVLFVGWPVGVIGLVAWLVGLYVRAGGQREVARTPPTATTGENPKPDPASTDPMT